MSKEYEYIKSYRKRLKEDLIKLFGGKCQVCGYDKFKSALEFHHLNPEEKEFSISSYSRLKKSVILNEAKKCALLCSNCHRGLHSGELTVELKQHILSEEYINKFLEITRRYKEYDSCPICGSKKEKSRKTCSLECAGKKSRKVDWDLIDLRQLLLSGENWTSISNMFDVTPNAVKKRAKKLKILHLYKSNAPLV